MQSKAFFKNLDKSVKSKFEKLSDVIKDVYKINFNL